MTESSGPTDFFSTPEMYVWKPGYLSQQSRPVVRARVPNAMKRVLVITYHWPPSGGVTVLRCLKLVKYLREFGWEPVVFTARDAKYQFEDPSNFKDVPDGLEVLRVTAPEPTNLFKRLTGRKRETPLLSITATSSDQRSRWDALGVWVRGNFFIPDARALWIRPSVRHLSRYLKDHPVDAIFTDGPPHTNTVIGLRLAQRFNLPWLADFQDPWTQVDYYADMRIGKRADRIHRALEQAVFRTASKISIASPTWARNLESIGARDVEVLPYGYDEADFVEYAPATDPSHFILFHGGLLGTDRNPIGLWEALGLMLQESAELRSRLRIRLAGSVDVEVRRQLSASGLDPYTEYLGNLPRTAVIEELGRAAVLLLPVNRAANGAGRIPGKLFELLRAGKPILSFSDVHGDVATLLEEYKAGITVGYEDTSKILDLLRAQLASTGTMRNTTDLQHFSNRALASKVAGWLDLMIH